MATFTDDGAEHTDLASCQDELDHLRTALRTRPVIDQAKGILMVGMDAALTRRSTCSVGRRNVRTARCGSSRRAS
jgi:hypothetical protein